MIDSNDNSTNKSADLKAQIISMSSSGKLNVKFNRDVNVPLAYNT